MSEARVVTEPLGGGALTRAALDGTAPAGWYAPWPASRELWGAWARRVADAAPADWLGRLAPAFSATGPAAARLARVTREGGVVVTTGQQPGLFGGPVYTWAKAFSALALADELERATGIATAPVFWAATDDADFAEARWTAVAVSAAPERLTLPRPTEPGRLLSDTPLGDVSALFARLVAAAGSIPHGEPLRLTRGAYGPGRTVGGAYTTLLRVLLEPLGVAVLDAAHEAVRDAARPLLERALSRAAIIEESLAARGRDIRRAHFGVQVAEVRGLSLVFEVSGGIKRRVRTSAATPSPGRGALLPNVLLRPLVERALLPTVGYLGGPGELAYFAQVSAVSDALEVATPVVLPRWSGTIVEPRIDRILERWHLTPADLRDPHAVERRLARAALPAELTAALAASRTALLRAVLDVERAAAPLAADGVVQGAAAAIEHRLARLERRLVVAAGRRDDDRARDLATARASLYPYGKRQERVLNFIPFLARYGDELRDRMRSAADAHARQLIAGPRAGVQPAPTLPVGDRG